MNYRNKNSQEIENSIYDLEKKASNINVKIKELNFLKSKKSKSKTPHFYVDLKNSKALKKNKKELLEKDLKIEFEKLTKKYKILVFILYIIILISLTLLAITFEINLINKL